MQLYRIYIALFHFGALRAPQRILECAVTKSIENALIRGCANKTMQHRCNITQYYAILCNITQYYAILCNITQYYAILRNITQYYAILCNITQYYAILCNIMQYYAILCNYIVFISHYSILGC